MADKTHSEPGTPGVLSRLAGIAVVAVVLAGIYVGYQALQVLFPPNTYETAMLATVADTVSADGVLLFDETYISGSGTLGYLAADGERVSAGAAVAEIYSSPEQAGLRQQLTALNDQIELLQRSQNTTATQLDSLRKERSGALYDLMDALDSSAYDETAQGEENYILAQNKLWVITGEVSDFSAQIAALTQQSAQVQAQLGAPTQIAAPQTGYFIRSTAAGRRNAGADDILALDAAGLEAYLNSDPELPLDGCAGKLVSGFTWRYVGLCSAKEGEKLLGDTGKPLTRSEKIINGDVLLLSRAKAQIIVDETTGLRIPIEAVHYLKEDGTESETQGENYIPGVYVKYGNLARFCKIDPVDSAHPLVTDGDYCIVMPSSTDKTKTISEVRLYDEIIVSGQNLYDGKLL